MILHEAAQGTAEWFEARCGVVSASNFDRIITTKGEPSKQREKYLYELAAERVTGKPLESFQSEAMARGVELEAEARLAYELLTERTVKTAGLCYKDETRQIGASPDGLVGDDGLLEIKCPQANTHVGYLLDDKLPTDYFQQVQGQLYVTGRKWLDFMSYYPGLKALVIRVDRDEKFITALSIELEIFLKTLDEITEKIK